MDQGPKPDDLKPAAWWSGSIAAFTACDEMALLGQLSHQATRHFRVNEATQLRAWSCQIRILQTLATNFPECAAWRLLLEFEIPRLRGRIDAVLLSPHAVFVLEFKIGAIRFDESDRQQAAGYAADLQDFHFDSRRHPILPILVATEATPAAQSLPLLYSGAEAVLDASPATLPALIRDLAAALPVQAHRIDMERWEHAAYRPVPNVIDAACLLFARHDVAEIVSARADTFNLTRTTDRIGALIAGAQAASQRMILFVTGIPGAGKTLCGLNAVFGVKASEGAAFLTGNPTLVHVLREALVRDAVSRRGESLTAARHRIKSMIQALPHFRDQLIGSGEVPAERVIIVDEAQRCWTTAQAVSRTRDRSVQLDRSEPAHLLDIMARHPRSAFIICLIGNGQEIHDGEGGLAEWGEALRTRPQWHVAAAPQTLCDPEPRNRLPALPNMTADPDLYLDVPIRSLRNDGVPAWVDAMLRADAAGARAVIAEQGEVPFRLTRSLAAMRGALRAACRDTHRSGLVCSAAARRLRAEGLGAELPHMDADAVAHWFLDHYPQDVRASDALEQVATQFSVQGLELDHVGLCWDTDLIRIEGQAAWQVRSFRGTDWQIAGNAQKIAYRLNTYRVLLTRARFETIIWVPEGDPADRTRNPRILDGIAAFLQACGVRMLADPDPVRMAEQPAQWLLPA